MRSFEGDYLDRLRFSPEDLSTLRGIGEFRGRQDRFAGQEPEILKRLRENAIIESAVSSNRIEGVEIGPRRAEMILRRASQPRNRPEQEVAGYREALDLIHGAYERARADRALVDVMPFTPNIVLQLHGTLYRFLPGHGGVWKNQDNEIVERLPGGKRRVRFLPVSAFETPRAVAALADGYRDATAAGRDPMVVVPLAALDLLCIHPFLDGNGRVARLATLLLLYHHGYEVGRYVSLERIIETSKETYYETLEASSRGWHEGRHDAGPWLRYFWGTLLAAYREFELRVEGAPRGDETKEARIRRAIAAFVDDGRSFQISDVESALEGISREWVRRTLRKMRDEGAIVAVGKGRGARWRPARPRKKK